MRRKERPILCLTLLLLLLPPTAMATSLEDAARQVSRQNNAKVLSARTVQRGNGRTHEIKLLTKKGVVKTVKVPGKDKKKKKKD